MGRDGVFCASSVWDLFHTSRQLSYSREKPECKLGGLDMEAHSLTPPPVPYWDCSEKAKGPWSIPGLSLHLMVPQDNTGVHQLSWDHWLCTHGTF